MTETPATWARRAGLALIVGPAEFVVLMGIEQALRPGFSSFRNTISELGVDIHGWSYAWMFTASIVTVGLLTVFAAYSLFRALGRTTRVGATLLAVAGLGYIGVGVFNEDVQRAAHSIFALDQFVMFGLAVLILAPVFGRDLRWGPTYTTFSRLCGILILVSLMLFLVGAGGPDYTGLVERSIVAPALLWAVITGLRFWNLPTIGQAT